MTLKTDEEYMQIALEAAHIAYKQDEVPIGAVVIDKDGNVLSIASNSGEHGKNALEHAEMKALYEASEKLNQTRLWDCTLYVTLEPCPMCATAISQMRIKKLVFGAENIKGGAVVNGVKFYTSKTCNHKPEVKGGVLATETSALLKDFFKLKRQ